MIRPAYPHEVSHPHEVSGRGWVAESDGRILGTIELAPLGEDWEIRRLAVDAAHRRQGLGARLLAAAATSLFNARALRVWTDTRHAGLHRFWERHSMLREPALRPLSDGSIKYGFRKPLARVAVEVLDAAGAESAVARLSDVLVACVETGASVSFLPPLDPSRAAAFWHGVARKVATGRTLLLAAWVDGTIVGTVSIDCDTPENQPHRADVQKLLVHPDTRRHGVGRALMQQAERAALAVGRSLLVLDTRGGDAGEGLYRAMGWTCAGCIPDYAKNADGTPCDTLLFYKTV